MSQKFSLPRRPRVMAVVVAVVLAFGSALIGASPAAADSTGTITGVVMGQGNPDAPLSGIDVELELPGGTYVQGMNTGDDGAYSFTGLSAADYIVYFGVPNYPASYTGEYWGGSTDAASASILSLGDGASATADITLPYVDITASVSGTVTDESGNPLSDINVDMSDGSAYGGVAPVVTDDNGNYTVSGLQAGSFTVMASDADGRNYVAQTLPDSIELSAGQTLTGVDITMLPGATVSGTVTEADNPGTPLGGGYVQVLDTNGYSTAGVSVNDDGTYTIEGVPAGSFTLQFSPSFDELGYATQYWQDEPSLAAADYFTVGEGDSLTGYDAALDVGASISGTVSTAGVNAHPLAKSSVYATSTADPLINYTGFVNDDGTYTIPGIAAGSYIVEFQPWGKNRADQWWNGASSPGAATPITVTTGQAVTGIDAALPLAATITGTLTGLTPSGAQFPADNGQVNVYLPDGTEFPIFTSVYLNGTFSIPNLPAGSYKLQFVAQPDTTDFAPEWYSNKSSLATATTVTLRAGQTMTIDVTLAPATLKAISPTITGTVKVGRTLTAVTGHWKPGAVTYSYQWLRDGVPIDGATAPTYTLTDADAGSPIRVTVTGAEVGYRSESLTSAPTKLVGNGKLTTAVPTISGTLAKGSTLTATPGTWGPGTVTLAYKWFRGTTRIVGATSSTYTLRAADVGQTITVKVIGSEAGYNTARVLSAPTAIIE
jgi:hypothetical protein